MNVKTANKLAKITLTAPYVARLATALKRLVDWSVGEQVYRDLFLTKKSVALGTSQLSFEIEPLIEAGIIVSNGETGSISSNVMVHLNPHRDLVPGLASIEEVYVMTDWPDTPPKKASLFDGREMVFPLHYESFAVLHDLLEQLDAGVVFRKCADIFAGSGVLGIYAHKLGIENVTFVEMLPRALAFSKLNAAMSGMKSATFVLSDCMKGIELGTAYDLILANPPFEPILEEDKDKYYHHSYGGPTGQEAMTRLLADMPQYLTEGGRAILVDFFLTDITGSGIHAQRSDIVAANPAIAQRNVEVHCHDQTPLWDFWLRYDALNLDRDRKLRTQILTENRAQGLLNIVLATIKISQSADEHTEAAKTRHSADITYEAKAPPSAWWNPLSWPLPCGIGIDAHSTATWFAIWARHEYEARSERAALYAESIAREPGNKIEYIDFAGLLFNNANGPAKDLISIALRSMVLDIRLLSIGSVIHPEAASLCLLPQDLSKDGSYIRIVAPESPVSIAKPHKKAVRDTDDIPILSNPIKDLNVDIAKASKSTSEFVFFYTVCDPGPIQESLLGMSNYSYQGSDIPYIGRYSLVHGGYLYEAPDFSARTFNYGKTLYKSDRTVQHYVLLVQLPQHGIGNLEKLHVLLGANWQEIVAKQLFHFVRYHLTSLAIPLILAKQAEEKQKYLTEELLLRIVKHGFTNWTANALSAANQGLREISADSPMMAIEAAISWCSIYCKIGALTCIALDKFGANEKKIATGELKTIIVDSAGLGDIVNFEMHMTRDTLLPGRVVLIVAELITNALRVQAQENNTPRIGISLESEDQDIVISIRNNSRRPDPKWLQPNGVGAIEKLNEEHGLWFCAHLIRQVEGEMSISWTDGTFEVKMRMRNEHH